MIYIIYVYICVRIYIRVRIYIYLSPHCSLLRKVYHSSITGSYVT